MQEKLGLSLLEEDEREGAGGAPSPRRRFSTDTFRGGFAPGQGERKASFEKGLESASGGRREGGAEQQEQQGQARQGQQGAEESLQVSDGGSAQAEAHKLRDRRRAKTLLGRGEASEEVLADMSSPPSAGQGVKNFSSWGKLRMAHKSARMFSQVKKGERAGGGGDAIPEGAEVDMSAEGEVEKTRRISFGGAGGRARSSFAVGGPGAGGGRMRASFAVGGPGGSADGDGGGVLVPEGRRSSATVRRSISARGSMSASRASISARGSVSASRASISTKRGMAGSLSGCGIIEEGNEEEEEEGDMMMPIGRKMSAAIGTQRLSEESGDEAPDGRRMTLEQQMMRDADLASKIHNKRALRTETVVTSDGAERTLLTTEYDEELAEALQSERQTLTEEERETIVGGTEVEDIRKMRKWADTVRRQEQGRTAEERAADILGIWKNRNLKTIFQAWKIFKMQQKKERQDQRRLRPYLAVLDKEPWERSEADVNMLLALVLKVKFFADLPQTVSEELCRLLKLQEFDEDEIVIRQGAEGDNFFIVLHGTCSVWMSEEKGSLSGGQLMGMCVAGESFGELSLLKKMPRAATVITDEPCWLVSIGKEEYEGSLKASRNKTMRAKIDFMVRQPCFSSASMAELHEMQKYMEMVNVNEGDALLVEGEEPSYLYFVMAGEVNVFKRLAEGQESRPSSHRQGARSRAAAAANRRTWREVAEVANRIRPRDAAAVLGIEDEGDDLMAAGEQVALLGKHAFGAHFGERAMVTKSQQKHTVVAASGVRVLRLSMHDFQMRLTVTVLDMLMATQPRYPNALQMKATLHKIARWESYKDRLVGGLLPAAVGDSEAERVPGGVRAPKEQWRLYGAAHSAAYGSVKPRGGSGGASLGDAADGVPDAVDGNERGPLSGRAVGVLAALHSVASEANLADGEAFFPGLEDYMTQTNRQNSKSAAQRRMNRIHSIIGMAPAAAPGSGNKSMFTDSLHPRIGSEAEQASAAADMASSGKAGAGSPSSKGNAGADKGAVRLPRVRIDLVHDAQAGRAAHAALSDNFVDFHEAACVCMLKLADVRDDEDPAQRPRPLRPSSVDRVFGAWTSIAMEHNVLSQRWSSSEFLVIGTAPEGAAASGIAPAAEAVARALMAMQNALRAFEKDGSGTTRAVPAVESAEGATSSHAAGGGGDGGGDEAARAAAAAQAALDEETYADQVLDLRAGLSAGQLFTNRLSKAGGFFVSVSGRPMNEAKYLLGEAVEYGGLRCGEHISAVLQRFLHMEISGADFTIEGHKSYPGELSWDAIFGEDGAAAQAVAQMPASGDTATVCRVADGHNEAAAAAAAVLDGGKEAPIAGASAGTRAGLPVPRLELSTLRGGDDAGQHSTSRLGASLSGLSRASLRGMTGSEGSARTIAIRREAQRSGRGVAKGGGEQASWNADSAAGGATNTNRAFALRRRAGHRRKRAADRARKSEEAATPRERPVKQTPRQRAMAEAAAAAKAASRGVKTAHARWLPPVVAKEGALRFASTGSVGHGFANADEASAAAAGRSKAWGRARTMSTAHAFTQDIAVPELPAIRKPDPQGEGSPLQGEGSPGRRRGAAPIMSPEMLAAMTAAAAE